MKRILDYNTYIDKVLGGWTGKSAGGILGAPIEGYKRFNNIELSEKLFETNYPNDDLDLQVLWLDMVKKTGPFVRSSDFGDFWKNHVNFPWNEYGIATRNLKLGVYPPQSGVHNNWYWKESMGCPIRSEIWGMLCPGMPEEAAYYARMDASLDHDDFSVHAEMFLAACEAEAFYLSDPREIIEKVLTLFEPDCTLHRLVVSVLHWHNTCSYEVAMQKIKGMWGDADFTSAPQNVGFSVLALLVSNGKFDTIMTALHLGHDSDCIAATVGAMLGIINGYSNISHQWKKLVGNDLIVSPEISGIKHAGSLTELAHETCRAGLSFINHFNKIELTNSPGKPFRIIPSICNVEVDITGYKTEKLNENQGLIIALENLDSSSTSKNITLELVSDEITFSETVLNAGSLVPFHIKVLPVEFQLNKTVLKELKASNYTSAKSSYRFEIIVKANGFEIDRIIRGIPYYGAWLLAGPFIEDNPEIEAMDKKYPDHGLGSMPGVNYMNHDKLNQNKEFLHFDDFKKITDQKNYNNLPFLTQIIYPNNFKIDLNQYFYGKGERTIYLFGKIFSNKTEKKWISIGCNAFIKVWFNDNLLFTRSELSRSWPGDITLETELKKGINEILIRVDMPLDKAEIEIGFKEFVNKHPHQSQWDTDLVTFV
jgi:ADP-ribosylglycohydrolase